MNFINLPEKAPHGVLHKIFYSNLVKQEVGYNIYLPPDYVKTDKKYPVMYWLHGMCANESTELWVAEFFQKYYTDNKTPNLKTAQMIIVFVNGTPASGYWNAIDGSLPIESIIITELIPHIDNTYRTISTYTGRVIEGFSMGGHGALLYAVKYPNLFCSIVAYAGSFGSVHLEDGTYGEWEDISGLFLDEFEELYNRDPSLIEPFTTYYWITKNADVIRRDLKIRIVVGRLDALFANNKKVHNLLDDMNIPHEYEIMQETDHDIHKMYTFCGERGLLFHSNNILQ